MVQTLKKIGLMQPYIFKVPDPKKILVRPDKLDIRVQIDWSNRYIVVMTLFRRKEDSTLAVSINVTVLLN